MKKWISAPLMFVVLSVAAQTDTVSAMFYNLLDFPSGGQSRVDTLKKIIKYTEPDILCVQELESLFGVNLILSGAMNTDGVTHYEKAVFYSGGDTGNMIFFNNQKFGLIEQFQISTVTRDVSEYHLYYKEPLLNSTQDTIHLWVYSCHLKAGSWQSNEDTRADEAEALKNYLANQNRTGNMIVGGDFNVYGSSEPAVQTILNSDGIYFNDPINLLGSWHNSSFYANIHTQSTRSSTGFAGGSSGGMDDRFDIIFASDDVMSGANRLQYLSGSYKAVGQDGNHFNGNINAGSNTAVPADIANALFYNSDHLPVYMEMVVDFPVGIQEQQNVISGHYFDSNEDRLDLIFKNASVSGNVKIYDLSGKLFFDRDIIEGSSKESFTIPLGLISGIYLVKVSTSFGSSVIKIVKE